MRLFPLLAFFASLLLYLSLVTACQARASETDLPQVQAAYFFNFIKFVRWPEAPDSPLVIRTFRSPAIAEALKHAPEKSIHSRSFDIEDVENHQDLFNADAVFIPRKHAVHIPEDAWKNFGAASLVVSDWDKTLDKGGTIRLLTVGGKIRFAVNLRHADKLVVSSKLLRLASEVRE